MYLIIIAWIYVVLMMAVAEATNSSGTVLGAVVTFFLYGVGPAGLVAYLMSAPARGKRNKKRQADAELAYAQRADKASPSVEPDTGSHAASGSETISETVNQGASPGVPPVREES
jgi:hypothetical protein